MKIVEILILVLSISLVFAKTDTKKTSLSNSNLKKEKSKDDIIEGLGDVPIHGVAVPNDNYILQHNAVNNFSF